ALAGSAAVLLGRSAVPGPLAGFFGSLTFILTVLAAGGLGGLNPALAATLISILAYDFFYVQPYFSLWPSNPADLLRLVAFGIVGAAIGLLCEGLHAAWRRVADRQRALEQEIAERRNAEQRLRLLWNAAAVLLSTDDPH